MVLITGILFYQNGLTLIFRIIHKLPSSFSVDDRRRGNVSYLTIYAMHAESEDDDDDDRLHADYIL